MSGISSGASGYSVTVEPFAGNVNDRRSDVVRVSQSENETARPVKRATTGKVTLSSEGVEGKQILVVRGVKGKAAPHRNRVQVTVVAGRADAMYVSQFNQRLAIGGALPGGYVLRQPLPVHLWREGREFVAASEYLSLHGYGNSPREALDELKAAIVEQHERLTTLENRLVPRMREIARRISAAIAIADA